MDLLALAGIVLTVILWVVSPESFRRRIRRFFARLFGFHPAAAIEPDMALFDGRVEVLTENLLSHPADAACRRQFYEAERPLDWDIIAAQADVERDQQEELLSQLGRSTNSLRFVCILGESGSGKSTLAWRVAAELHRRQKALVLHVKGSEGAEVWYRMPAFCSLVGRHVYVLADDLFRDPEVRIALQQLSPWLPLTILATSQTHEFRSGRLKGDLVVVPLKEVSSGERDRALGRLGEDLQDLNPDETVRLQQAGDFLVLMAELTSGKGFQAIVQESLDNLAKRHPAVYRAYEYICFTYSHSVAVPAALLERLDPQGSFHNLPYRDGARGLVFHDDLHPECLRPGHPRRADLATRHFQKKRPAMLVLEELVKAADPSVPLQRRFVAHLLRHMTTRSADMVGKVLPRLQSEIASCATQANISELATWRTVYLRLDQPEEAERLVDAAFARAPVSPNDINILLSLYRERSHERDALPVVERWIQSHSEWGTAGPAYLGLVEKYGAERDRERALANAASWLAAHPGDNHVRTAYLSLVERVGTAAQIERVLAETAAWLAAHPDDNHVRTAYLGLVERVGTAAQIERALKETAAWLASHPDNNHVRTAYLGLVERKGTARQIRTVLKETSAWLASRPDNSHVRTAYLGLVERKGTAEQVQAVLKETSGWLDAHPDDNVVRTAYLGLVERKGTLDQIGRFLAETADWLATHLADNAVRTAYLGLVERKGTAGQTEHILGEIADWLAAHPDDRTVRSAYLGLVERNGTPEQTGRVLAETADWLAVHPDDNYVRTAYLGLVERKGTPDQTERVLEETSAWLRSHPNATDVWTRLLSLLLASGRIDDARALTKELVSVLSTNPNLATQYLRLVQDQFDEKRVRELYESTMDLFPRSTEIKNAWARWLTSIKRFREAEAVFLALIDVNPKDFRPRHGYGRMLLQEDRFKEAEDQFRQVLRIHRGHAMAHDGLATALLGLARQLEAKSDGSGASAFAAAEREFKNAIYWSGIAQFKQAIFFTHLGWFYIDRERWSDALGAFDQAAAEAPEYFGNYWGMGQAFAGLGQWPTALGALRTALEKAPDPLGPPASEDIPRLIQRCEEALASGVR